MSAAEPTTLASRYAAVKGSLPDHVTLVAVSKKRSVEEIQALYDLGHRDFGENYPQELREKAPQLPTDIRWHFIGHLQRSNVKHVVPLCQLIHGVDSSKLMAEVDKRSAAIGRTMDVLLQVHIGQEESKHGFSVDELGALLSDESDPQERWPNCRVCGLMGMATNTTDHHQVYTEFRGLADLHQAIRTNGPFPAEQFTILSQGMSGDVDVALRAGSNMVRIGTAIFGERT